MTCCEKCWSDSGGSLKTYMCLIELRSAYGPRCSPQEQAGQYWDEARQRDRRLDEVLSKALKGE